MSTRKEIILSHDFFADKQDLAEQILLLEEDNKGVLPNSFKTTILPPQAFDFGDKSVTLGRVEEFYFFGVVTKERTWKYQAFENESKCKQFFINLTDGIENRQIQAFWLGRIALLSTN